VGQRGGKERLVSPGCRATEVAAVQRAPPDHEAIRASAVTRDTPAYSVSQPN